MKYLIFSLLFFALPVMVFAQDTQSTGDYKPYVGFDMSLNKDLIQVDPKCTKQSAFWLFGNHSMYDQLVNTTQTGTPPTNQYKTQTK